MKNNYSKIFSKKENDIIETISKPEQEATKISYFDTFVKVTTNNLNLRIEPNKSSGILCVLEAEEILNVKERSNGWLKVVTTDNLEGYIIEGHTSKVV